MKAIGIIIYIAVVLLIAPTIIYCLWDDVMVKFFEVQDVTFADSIWISILSSVLFKSSYSSND